MKEPTPIEAIKDLTDEELLEQLRLVDSDLQQSVNDCIIPDLIEYEAAIRAEIERRNNRQADVRFGEGNE